MPLKKLACVVGMHHLRTVGEYYSEERVESLPVQKCIVCERLFLHDTRRPNTKGRTASGKN